MSRKCYLVGWNEPSKYFKDEMVRSVEIFNNKKDAEECLKKARTIEGATGFNIYETECTSL